MSNEADEKNLSFLKTKTASEERLGPFLWIDRKYESLIFYKALFLNALHKRQNNMCEILYNPL